MPLLEGTSDEALAAGFGHFEDTARAGAKGNFALAGHRITHGEPLRDMPGLEPGDEIVVETARATYTYVLDTAGDALEVRSLLVGCWTRCRRTRRTVASQPAQERVSG